jgi:hypothetical protein
LSPGQHNLVVEYLGNSSTVPFSFSYFIQQDEISSITSSSNSSPSSSIPTGNHRTPTDAIIGGVIGGLVLISLLLALFFFNRRRNNRRFPSPDVVNPFIFPYANPTSTMTSLPKKYTSNGYSLPSQSISSKFTSLRSQLSDPASTSSGGGTPSLTRLQRRFSSPAFTPSGSSLPPLTASQITFDDSTMTRVPQDATEPSIRFLQHNDSGVRIPAEDEEVQVVELPPVYSTG